MHVNADFSRRAVAALSQHPWVPSPQAGVERIMLDRTGGERARATSFVRYARGAAFPHHRHPGGEEILVLRGSFREGATAYPAGWYLRNPPGSAHAPSSPEGALIFVKLGQMATCDDRTVRIDTRDPSAWRGGVCPLFADDTERTCLLRLAPGASPFDDVVGGAELLVLGGSVLEDRLCHRRGTWIRLPGGTPTRMRAGPRGAVVYLKTGHLPGAEARA